MFASCWLISGTRNILLTFQLGWLSEIKFKNNYMPPPPSLAVGSLCTDESPGTTVQPDGPLRGCTLAFSCSYTGTPILIRVPANFSEMLQVSRRSLVITVGARRRASCAWLIRSRTSPCRAATRARVASARSGCSVVPTVARRFSSGCMRAWSDNRVTPGARTWRAVLVSSDSDTRTNLNTRSFKVLRPMERPLSSKSTSTRPTRCAGKF